MKLDPVRKARQESIIQKWKTAGSKGTAQCTTGFGKTVLAMLTIQQLQAQGTLKTVVIVPTLYLKDQWEDRLQEFGLSNCQVLVINTAVKEKIIFCDLLILDEIHQYTAETFGQIFDRVSYKNVLGLTATLREDDSRNALIHQHAPVIDTVTLAEALANEWVAPFGVFNLAVTLTSEEEKNYQDLSKKFNRYFASFGHDFRLAMNCVSDPYWQRVHARNLNWEEARVRAAAYQFISNMRLRKEMLYELESKHALAAAIINQFPSRRVITFSQTIDSAKKVAELVGEEAVLYHSKMRKKAKESALSEFTSPSLDQRVLCTAKALDMGADIPNIDLAIILSGTSAALQGIQRYGRSLRKNGDRRTIIVELYAPNTQDERWLRSRQKKTPKKVIRWIRHRDDIK